MRYLFLRKRLLYKFIRYLVINYVSYMQFNYFTDQELDFEFRVALMALKTLKFNIKSGSEHITYNNTSPNTIKFG